MPRMNLKAMKIAYKIMGKPASIAFKPSEKQKEVNKRLLFTETDKSR